MKALTWLCLCLALVLQSHAQGTLQPITFDGPPLVPPDWDIASTNYEEGPMRFSPAINIAGSWRFGRSGGAREGFPQTGSQYLIFLFTCSLRGVMADRTSFGLYSVDLAEFSTLYPYPQEVPFFGYKADGSMVTNTFVTDGIIDGTGPLADFETFYFDKHFSDIVAFELWYPGYALDNLTLVVPEPSAGSLITTSAVCFWFFRGRPR